MASRTLLALDVGPRDLHAVEAVADRGRISVLRVVHAALPAPAQGTDATPEERGAQVRALLAAAGITATGAVWTLPRERVVFKRIDLPAAEAYELPGMVRLAVQNETSMGGDAALDFVELAGLPSTVRGAHALWAVAVPQGELTALRRMAAAARISVERVAPRTCGTAALMATLPVRDAEGDCSVAFDLASESAELVAADGTGLRATRGTTIAPGTPDAAVTEARRSWAALRLSMPDPAPARALVLGGAAVAAALAAAFAADIPVRRLESHPDVDAGDAELGSAWPLAGLLLETARKVPHIDLAHPRRTPDVAARRRLRVYAAVGVVALAYCCGWLVGGKERAGIEHRRADLEEKANDARTEYFRHLRDDLKAKHLDAWVASQPQWLDAMLHLHGFAPDPARVVLESWSGQVDEVEVAATREGAFRLPPGVRIALDVETTDRSSADALREALISRGEWVVKSTSSEGKAGRRLPVAVQLLLTAPAGAPVEGSAGTPAGAPAGAPAAPATASPAGAAPAASAPHAPAAGALHTAAGSRSVLTARGHAR